MTRTFFTTAGGVLPDPRTGIDRRKLAFVGLLCLAGLLAAVYWPALYGGFVFDDFPNIVMNKALRVGNLDPVTWLRAAFSSESGELQRPIAMLSFAIQYYFTDLDPAPMKAVNLGIHILNTLLVYALGRRLFRATNEANGNDGRWQAFLLAALWGCFPINFFPATFIVQRMESMAQTFVLLGLWSYCAGRERQRQGRNGWLLVLSSLFVCTPLGILCKESAALLPAYCLCIELFLFRFAGGDGRPNRTLVALYVPALYVPAIAGAAWTFSRALKPWAYSTRNFTLVERLLTEPRVLIDYIRWTFFPDIGRMSMFHDDYVVSHGLFSPVSTFLALVAIAALVAIGWFLRNRRPLLGLGLWWFLAGHLLTATYIPLELVFEHRNYFPSLGLAMVMVELSTLATARTRMRGAIAASMVAIALIYAGVTHLRALEWSNPLRFAAAEAAKQPDSARSTYQLGQALVVASRADPKSPLTSEAIDALERARRVRDGNILAAQGLLLFSAQLGREPKDEWWDEIIDRLDHQPIGAQERGAIIALSNCAVSRRCAFPRERMLAMYVTALTRSYHPVILSAYANYVLNVVGNRKLAIGLLREATRLSPGIPQYRANLALALMLDGQFDRARSQIERLDRMPALGQGPRLAAQLRATMRKQLERSGTKSAPAEDRDDPAAGLGSESKS